MLGAGKEKPNVLLTGRTGQIGSELEKQLAPLVRLNALDRSRCDLEQLESLRSIMRNTKPTLVINAAGYTAVDQAEIEPAKARAINAESVRVLAEECRTVSAVLVHYSTDYVFDGSKSVPYVESDPPNPLNVYGQTKLAGEQAIEHSGCSYLILRTAWIYSAGGKNFVRTIARLAQAEPELRVVEDQYGAPTLARDVATATVQILAKAAPSVRELYHLTAAGETTWYGLASEVVNELVRRNRSPAKLRPVTTAEYSTLAKRPRNSVLSNEKLKADFDVQMPHWRESLQITLKHLIV